MQTPIHSNKHSDRASQGHIKMLLISAMLNIYNHNS